MPVPSSVTLGEDCPRVAVIGGGVIGLGIGWRLARAGCPVTVFDRDEAGRSASWAAGGMLAAGVETEPGEEQLWQLASRSQHLWPDFRYALQADGGRDIGYRDEGTLVVALTRDDLEQARAGLLHSFYLRPAVLWRQAAHVLAHPRLIPAMGRGVLAFRRVTGGAA